ncbi:MAG: Rrf2 family transcriptional regulator [Nitrospirae bacterium]|nr:Rrf2 family transcriptional regulator [Nitrospirota bacterium]MBI3350964.1 Rrf2 family transcriptional regulator [Nitrospirota bacterium]
MELTQFTDYSLRVLIFLGRSENRISTIREIADYYQISENHLMKIIPHLVRKGYIQSIRGKGGGIRLSKSPGSIKIGKLVRETEESLEVVECFKPGENSCALLPGCTLKSALHQAMQNFLGTLDQYTLSDLLGIPNKKGATAIAVTP